MARLAGRPAGLLMPWLLPPGCLLPARPPSLPPRHLQLILGEHTKALGHLAFHLGNQRCVLGWSGGAAGAVEVA